MKWEVLLTKKYIILQDLTRSSEQYNETEIKNREEVREIGKFECSVVFSDDILDCNQVVFDRFPTSRRHKNIIFIPILFWYT